jgi:hypothetical protein
MEQIYQFWLQVNNAPGIVWSLATLMAVVSAYILHTYIGDYAIATLSGFGMFVAVLVGHVAFTELGVFFTSDKESNVAASAGAAICSVTLLMILFLRLWHAAFLLRTRLRGNEDLST